ncbi:MAG TPA: DUF167 domain-containing protein [Blastocatellia bacterium]|nr:DUF167 domain-containing protein [Blastocatellia bacterium]
MKEKNGAVTFKLRVQPRASRTELAGEYGDALKLRITAPPVEGKANAECRRFLAKLLDVPASAVEIVAGASSKDKVIRVHNMDASRVREALRR